MADPRRASLPRSRTPEYRAWCSARRRCTNPTDKAWSSYGGRGIQFHPAWLGEGGFEKFLAHVGPKPSPRHTLDRIVNNGNYARGNVQWATWGEQARNRRSNTRVTINGRTQTLSAWLEELGMGRSTYSERVANGCSPEQALSRPVRRYRHGAPREPREAGQRWRGIDPNTGIEMRLTIHAWARRVGIDRTTIARRLDRGWDLQRAITEPPGPAGGACRGALDLERLAFEGFV